MVLPEPVEEWQNVNGTDLLDLMFHNGTRYFGTFQLESSFTRYIIPLFVFNSRKDTISMSLILNARRHPHNLT